ncbi:MAG: polyprenyl synthetase family protein [Defluviitaleaceae bacterium]|nr:polyprenyl synthetase family protein [Defluviitaleaceae bacterium]MCL2274325.1 polyprenyl synthetase family protein [Defluviitaleaceae bacterium]
MIKQIDACLERLIATCEEPSLRDAMHYAALGAGKRIRPRLFLAACEAMCGGYDEAALQFACCLEMIHAYSLVHDDLPAMDNDDLRRGRPTVHKQFDEATAILAGDALLSHAFEIMARVCACAESVQQDYAQTMLIIARAAGANGMIAGQVRDLASEGKQLDMDTLEQIHRRKTGALFAAALEAGATLGGNTHTQEMRKLGYTLGLAFQIRDDILDVTSTAEALGKNPGSDINNQKSTYVSLAGLETAQEMYKNISADVLALVDSIPAKTLTLRDLITQVLTRDK